MDIRKFFNEWREKGRIIGSFLLLAVGFLLDDIVSSIDVIASWGVWSVIIVAILLCSFPWKSVTEKARFRRSIKTLQEILILTSNQSGNEPVKQVVRYRLKRYCRKYSIDFPDEEDYSDGVDMDAVWNTFQSTLFITAEYGELKIARKLNKLLIEIFNKLQDVLNQE